MLIYSKSPLQSTDKECWYRYIEETIEQDHATFNSDTNENEYIDNFTAIEDAVDNDTGGGVPGNLVGTIGSMASILDCV